MRSIFLISGLVIGGLGGWAIAQLGETATSIDQVLAASEAETEPSVTSTTTEPTQPPTETTVDGQEDATTTTLATDSDPETTTTTEETSPPTSTTTTTLATDSDQTTTTTTPEETPTTTEAPDSDPSEDETPPATSTTTTTEAPDSDPATQEPPPTTTPAPQTSTPPASAPAPTTPTPATTPALSTDSPSTAIQLSGCRVPWDEGVRCVVARGVNHEPGQYGIEQTLGSWSCTIELPELRSSESFGYMICPPVETVTDLDGTRSYVPPGNRRLYGLDQVQEIVDQLDDCQMRIRNVNLPISVQTEEGVAQVERPAIEHILHCVLRQ